MDVPQSVIQHIYLACYGKHGGEPIIIKMGGGLRGGGLEGWLLGGMECNVSGTSFLLFLCIQFSEGSSYLKMLVNRNETNPLKEKKTRPKS